MNPTAIYSKSGKGVQEASGKTSFLDRGDRAVLSAIDGRATLGDVAKKVGKNFDPAFQTLISKLDKDGFIREASPGTAAAAPAAKPAAGKAAAKPAAKGDDGGGGFGDLDFSSLGGGAAPKPAAAPPRPAPPPSRPAAPPPPPPPPPPKPNPAAEAQAKAQQSALQKAREEAEAKADAERQRIKAEAEAKMRSEMEAKARDEASQKLKLEAERKAKEEADAKIRAAQEAAARAAAEAKAKAEAEARARVEAERKAREEAERARKAAEEEARRAREEAERARKAAEEEARKAREEAERIRKAAEEEARRAREEAERARKAAEEERKREEAERQARRKREEEEEAARRKAREEEERRREEEDRRRDEERAATRRQREEQEAREAEESAARARKKREDESLMPAAPPPAAAAKSEAAGGLDSLMADLDSFTTREDDERRAKEEAERKEKEAAAQRAREEEERRAREEAERRAKEEARARKEEAKRRKREEEEEFARQREKEEARLREEEEKRKKEADERARKAKQEEVLAAQANRGPAVAVGEDTDEVRKRMIGRGRSAAGAGPASVIEPPSLRRRRSGGLGKPIAITLVVLLVAAVAAVHVMPVSTADYERAASEAFGRPVKIGEARLSLMSGLQIKLSDIRLGDDVRIKSGAATPELETLRSERKVFSRIDLDGVKLPQEAIGQALLAKVKADNFAVARIVVHGLELAGPAVLPSPLEADLSYAADGSLRSATVRGPDTLLVRITPGTNNIEYVVTASGLPLPILPEMTLSDFGMKGTANQRGMSIAEWGGKIYGGSISGTANVRWGGGWAVDGVLTVRNINAAVLAPALLSEGRAEGTGRFSMSGADPSKLAAGGRLEGTFTIGSGVLGSFDLGRAIRSSGKEYAGRTQFSELTGQGTYEQGAVSLRNVAIGAGALNAGASADVAQSGALSGRIVADVKASSTGRAASATLHLGGTIKEPQVRN